MTKIVTLVGSGNRYQVEMEDGEYIFVNSAVLRANANNSIDVVITQGMLWSDEELMHAANAKGLNRQKSLNMRSAKRDAFCSAKIRRLYIVSNEDESKLRERLSVLGVSYQQLVYVSKRHVARRMLMLSFRVMRPTIQILRLIFWSFINSLLNITIPSCYRPSTGGIALLLVMENRKGTEFSVQLDGIGSSEKDAFYPNEKGELVQHQFNNVHHLADGLIFRTYRKNIKFR